MVKRFLLLCIVLFAGIAAHAQCANFGGCDTHGGLSAIAVANAPVNSNTSPCTLDQGARSGNWGCAIYNGRWALVTPEGHPLFCNSAYDFSIPNNSTGAISTDGQNLNATGIAKFGNFSNWEKAALQQYKAFGFNCLVHYPGATAEQVFTDIRNNVAGVPQMPWFHTDHALNDAMQHRDSDCQTKLWGVPGIDAGCAIDFTGIPDEMKDIMKSTYQFVDFTENMPDAFDPNWAPYLKARSVAYTNPTEYANNPFHAAAVSLFAIGYELDDSDFFFGVGPGPDFCAKANDGADYPPHVGWAALTAQHDPPWQWTFGSDNLYDTRNWAMSDTKLYAKYDLANYLQGTADQITGVSASRSGSAVTLSSSVSVSNFFVGEKLTVLNCSDTTFNTVSASPVVILSIDYVNKTIGYTQSGAGTSATACHVGAGPGYTLTTLNAAWGSHYTTFGTTGTRTTGETIAVTNGTSGSYTHTLAVNPTQYGHGSLLLKVDGNARGAEAAQDGQHSGNYAANILSQWPDGSTVMQGTISTAGVVNIVSQSPAEDFFTGTGSTSWNLTLSHTNIVPTTMFIYLWPNQCRISDDLQYPANQWETYTNTCPLSPYTVTGTPNYAAGTMSITITDKNGAGIPNTNQLRVSYQYQLTLSAGHTITADYETGGYGFGTGVLDEDGTCPSRGVSTCWLGANNGIAAYAPNDNHCDASMQNMTCMPATPSNQWLGTAAVKQDLDDWMVRFVDRLYGAIDQIRQYYPHQLMGGIQSAGHIGCARPAWLLGAQRHLDYLHFGQFDKLNADEMATYNVSIPVTSWDDFLSNLDSQFAGASPCFAGDTQCFRQYSTQAARGTAWAGQLHDVYYYGKGNGTAPPVAVGFRLWQYLDQPGENHQYGMVTMLGDIYNGHDNVTTTPTCSAPLDGSVVGPYTCGSEPVNSGDSMDTVKATALQWPLIFQSSTQPATSSHGINKSGGDDERKRQ